ncbi:DUF4145 domain-containing protein [Thiohalobacter thiocyanaticus]|uniref:DUF4145 domain-containing protein n=1 Tax=Thiohalobacter thiocyanaticus TaxID=585455 RepID=A0A426QKG8_9GAMM|nr:DUF4145 domain-containing protein [Thiohalobacter thiocyanaticus]RRQ22248.1 DUF4145 domain-containing protein [Thiohalobacter thiocyanaticus]
MVLAEKECPPNDYVEPHKYVFMECPGCSGILLGYSEYAMFSPTEEGWADPSRLWPEPREYFDICIPSLVRRSLEDARKCFQARVYTASAVMCGRAIEAICKDKTNEKTLHKGLKKLKVDAVIDDRLYSWGEALRKERNIGAHASEDTVSKQDAQDIFDFAKAIAEYVYVMAEKFDAYEQRKQKKMKT